MSWHACFVQVLTLLAAGSKCFLAAPFQKSPSSYLQGQAQQGLGTTALKRALRSRRGWYPAETGEFVSIPEHGALPFGSCPCTPEARQKRRKYTCKVGATQEYAASKHPLLLLLEIISNGEEEKQSVGLEPTPANAVGMKGQRAEDMPPPAAVFPPARGPSSHHTSAALLPRHRDSTSRPALGKQISAFRSQQTQASPLKPRS